MPISASIFSPLPGCLLAALLTRCDVVAQANWSVSVWAAVKRVKRIVESYQGSYIVSSLFTNGCATFPTRSIQNKKINRNAHFALTIDISHFGVASTRPRRILTMILMMRYAPTRVNGYTGSRIRTIARIDLIVVSSGRNFPNSP